MSSSEIRKIFLEFFKARGHAIIPSASLVPENDPTTLFTGSGMQPLILYLLGAPHPLGKRLANSQKSFRTEDIDEVGDNRHTTFFEMLGNWSLGSYWKEEQLPWFLEFLTKEVGIPKNKLWVTCFAGDKNLNLPPDNESAEIWKKIGIPEERICFYDARKNWWSRSGPPSTMPVGEPGGPDSEVFYEFTAIQHNPKFGEKCHPNCDCGRFMEIGNSVFMEYKKTESGFENLTQRNVDFGGGLERITAASNDEPDIFKIDVFVEMEKAFPQIKENDFGKKRIVLDHLRASAFLILDSVRPSNKEKGYVLRRLLRRAALSARSIFGAQKNDSWLLKVLEFLAKPYAQAYPELGSRIMDIAVIIIAEFSKFEQTLDLGLREFNKLIQKGNVSGKDAFILFSTYGFPYEMTFELAREHGVSVSNEEFIEEMKKHQEISSTASAGIFKGGLADTSEKTTQLHTAHHLLLKALQIVLGPQVKQRGSNITQERLRLDFLHGEKLTEEQKKEVERIVNEKIAEDLPVIRSELAREEAEKLGAEMEFGQKYPERVSVYSVGPKTATPENPQFKEAYSIEFCGGPHVAHTGEIKGKFSVAKEEAVGAGVRRIRGILE